MAKKIAYICRSVIETGGGEVQEFGELDEEKRHKYGVRLLEKMGESLSLYYSGNPDEARKIFVDSCENG